MFVLLKNVKYVFKLQHVTFHTLYSCYQHDSHRVPPLYVCLVRCICIGEVMKDFFWPPPPLTPLAQFGRARPHAALLGCKSLWVEYVGWEREEQNWEKAEKRDRVAAGGVWSVCICLWLTSWAGLSLESGWPKPLPEALPRGLPGIYSTTEAPGLTWDCLQGQQRNQNCEYEL